MWLGYAVDTHACIHACPVSEIPRLTPQRKITKQLILTYQPSPLVLAKPFGLHSQKAVFQNFLILQTFWDMMWSTQHIHDLPLNSAHTGLSFARVSHLHTNDAQSYECTITGSVI